MPHRTPMNQSLHEIKAQLLQLHQQMSEVSSIFAAQLQSVHPDNRSSALNFLNYLALRKTDIQELQYRLHTHGLSSLASCESHTRRQIEVTLQHLGVHFDELDSCTGEFGTAKIEESSNVLFGPKPENWPASVMVTFDSSFLGEDQLTENLLINGMGVARINCAHDDEAKWKQMVDQIRRASKNTGLPCKIHIDLAGPKIRTVLLSKGKNSGKIKVDQGSILWLSDTTEGLDKQEAVISPNEPGVIDSLKVGDRVLIDDGMIKGIVERLENGRAQVRIIRISSKKTQIKAGKGLNFPDSTLDIPSLTAFDRACLPFVCAHADTVGYSFVRKASEIAELRKAMRAISPSYPPIILKIETHEAVEDLPELLLEAMADRHFGVMIARGDLAVEIGFERLVEVQEEILWICEAAHVPVIWATQVLENLHKSGLASRAEVTDAGRAALAECIMINKGPHTLEVLRTLKDITQRSAGFRIKNRLVFRPLRIAANFWERS